ncbi:hypothetical protein GCM10027064_04700 [Microbacterium petrolearium]|jgi:NAD(P)-dependent dehydrogenase (short-subunit alcohol dehydrogenase family)
MSWNPDRLPDLRGRVYAVTGATGGIGYFAAEQLAAAGAEVVLVSRSAAKLEYYAPERAMRGRPVSITPDPRTAASPAAADIWRELHTLAGVPVSV